MYSGTFKFCTLGAAILLVRLTTLIELLQHGHYIIKGTCYSFLLVVHVCLLLLHINLMLLHDTDYCVKSWHSVLYIRL